MSTWVSVVALVLGALGTAGIGGMLKTWLDHKRGVRKQTDEVAMALVEKLEARVEKLEGDQERERERCEALLAVLRHRVNNGRQMIYSLLHLFDMPAARRKDALAGIRAELAAMETAEATEKGLIAAAVIRGDEAPSKSPA